MDDAQTIGSNRSERAQTLLTKIAALLGVDTAFFLSPRPDDESPVLPGSDPSEMLRIFQAIDDPELRRSVLTMLKDLGPKDDTDQDS